MPCVLAGLCIPGYHCIQNRLYILCFLLVAIIIGVSCSLSLSVPRVREVCCNSPISLLLWHNLSHSLKLNRRYASAFQLSCMLMFAPNFRRWPTFASTMHKLQAFDRFHLKASVCAKFSRLDRRSACGAKKNFAVWWSHHHKVIAGVLLHQAVSAQCVASQDCGED